MSAFDTCCTYFCLGLSIFGVLGTSVLGLVLLAGGSMFLGVEPDEAAATATGLFVAAGIYLAFLLWCGSKVMRPSKPKDQELQPLEKPFI